MLIILSYADIASMQSGLEDCKYTKTTRPHVNGLATAPHLTAEDRAGSRLLKAL